MSEWQPIETAPKDGTSMLVVSRDGLVMIDKWHVCHTHPLGKPSYLSYNDWQFSKDPTHWMPLPAPPAVNDASQGTASGGGK